MRIERELQEADGSVMLQIPEEMLKELRWEPGRVVTLESEGGGLRIEPAARKPPPEVARFMAEFVEHYDEAMRELSRI